MPKLRNVPDVLLSHSLKKLVKRKGFCEEVYEQLDKIIHDSLSFDVKFPQLLHYFVGTVLFYVYVKIY